MARDRRGYETTALVETGGRRRKGQRLLYYFRTPPSIRVGREAIDGDAMRLLEQHNPDVSFDWERLLKPGAPGSSGPTGPGSGPAGPGGPQGSPGSRQDRRRERREQRRPRPGGDPAQGTTAFQPEQRPRSSGPDEMAEPGDEREQASEPAEEEGYPEASDSTADAAEWREPSSPGTPSRSESPSSLENPEDVNRGNRFTSANPSPATLDPASPEHREPVQTGGTRAAIEPAAPIPERYARLGSAGLDRLRARYADLSARLAAKTLEDDVRAELAAKAERLNPDGWTTAEDVAAALEDYEATFESLRAVVGRQPRGRP